MSKILLYLQDLDTMDKNWSKKKVAMTTTYTNNVFFLKITFDQSSNNHKFPPVTDLKHHVLVLLYQGK